MSTVVKGGCELICENDNSMCGEFSPAVGSAKPSWLKGAASLGKRIQMRLFKWFAIINGPVRVLFHCANAASRSKLYRLVSARRGI